MPSRSRRPWPERTSLPSFAAAENRSAGEGGRQLDQVSIRRQLSGRSLVPRAGRRTDPAPEVTGGACAPCSAPADQPLRLPDRA